MELDHYLPHYNFSSKHQISINSTRDIVFEAIHNMDFDQFRIIRFLLKVRRAYAVLGFGKLSWDIKSNAFTKEATKGGGFIILEDLPGKEIVFGFAGQFWKPSGRLVNFSSKEEYLAYTPTNACKGAWNFYLQETNEGALELLTETRVFCPGRAVRRMFGTYWLIIGLFSGLIRIALLKNIKRMAERNIEL